MESLILRPGVIDLSERILLYAPRGVAPQKGRRHDFWRSFHGRCLPGRAGRTRVQKWAGSDLFLIG